MSAMYKEYNNCMTWMKMEIVSEHTARPTSSLFPTLWNITHAVSKQEVLGYYKCRIYSESGSKLILKLMLIHSANNIISHDSRFVISK